MNQILSQNEVEALLKAVGDDSMPGGGDGGPSEAAVTTALASAPRSALGNDRRFEEIRPLLEDVFDLTIKGFRSFLLGMLAKDISVERFSMEAISYVELTRRYDIYGRPYTFMPFELTPPEKIGVVIFEPGLAIGLMEGFMGGTLDGEPVPTWRPLTTLELKVAEKMNRELLDALGKAIHAKLGANLEPLKLQPNAHLVKGMKEMTQVVAVGLRVLIRGKSLGECYVLLPQDLVDGLTKADGSTSGPTDEEVMVWEQTMVESLFDVDVQVSAELGSVEMSVRQLIDLKVGDVIPLERARPGEAILKVEGVAKLKVMPGVYRGRKALRIIG